MNMNEKGFSAVVTLLFILVVAVVGFGGYNVWHSQIHDNQKTVASSKSSSTNSQKEINPTDPYTGWKTYASPLRSGLSFKYPAEWDFKPNTTVSTPNNLGGVENDSVLRSAKIQGTYGTVTNQYMCVSIDEYSSSGWDFPSNWTFGKELSSEQLTTGTLTTYAGDTPMQSELILHSPNSLAGNHFVTTNNGFVVSVKAAFNSCQQPADNEGITNKQADFNQQPETDVAKKIIKSIQF